MEARLGRFLGRSFVAAVVAVEAACASPTQTPTPEVTMDPNVRPCSISAPASTFTHEVREGEYFAYGDLRLYNVNGEFLVSNLTPAEQGSTLWHLPPGIPVQPGDLTGLCVTRLQGGTMSVEVRPPVPTPTPGPTPTQPQS